MATKDPLQHLGDSIHEPASAPVAAPDWNNPRVLSLLDAAAGLFARKGFAGATLAELGSQVGLRKSIVHYYFESKAALIHEVQRFAYHKYLDRVRQALEVGGESSLQRMMSAMTSLWGVRHDRWATTALNIELWSATRRDAELKQRAADLQRDSRALIGKILSDVLGPDLTSKAEVEGVSTLILSVLNGLALAEYLEEDETRTRRAYDLFTYFLRLAILDLAQRAPRPG